MSNSATDTLFRPFRIHSLELPNRIVMAPMTRSFAPRGVVGPRNAEYYRRRAAGGVGLILSEGTVIDRPASRNEPDVPSFFGDEALAGWKGVIEAVHAAGGKMGPQLWHTGATVSHRGDWSPDAAVESPSGIDAPGVPRGVAMSEEAISDTVAAFASAAGEARRLGFDLIELHGAHGYLIDQFFWDGTNLRSDRFGGKHLRERSRFAAEVVTAVRDAVGPDFPIALRVSQWKQQDYSARLANTPHQLEDWLAPLVAAGVDLLHCSQRRYWEPEFPEIDGPDGLNLAGWAKKVTGAATVSVGSVGLDLEANETFAGKTSTATGIERLVKRMERDEFDLIAVGRALIADADWPEKIRTGDTAALSAFAATSLNELV